MYVARTVFHDRQIGLEYHLPQRSYRACQNQLCNHNRRTVAGCLHGRLTPCRVLRRLRTEVSLSLTDGHRVPWVAISRSGSHAELFGSGLSPCRLQSPASVGTYLLLGIRFSMSKKDALPGSNERASLLYHIRNLLSRGFKKYFYIFLLFSIVSLERRTRV